MCEPAPSGHSTVATTAPRRPQSAITARARAAYETVAGYAWVVRAFLRWTFGRDLP